MHAEVIVKPVLKIQHDEHPSVLERIARAVEPTDKELRRADALPEGSRVARVLRPAYAIQELSGKLNEPGAAVPSKPIAGALVRMHDREIMQFHTDGSLRHAGGRVKGKAARKAFKRMRRKA